MKFKDEKIEKQNKTISDLIEQIDEKTKRVLLQDQELRAMQLELDEALLIKKSQNNVIEVLNDQLHKSEETAKNHEIALNQSNQSLFYNELNYKTLRNDYDLNINGLKNENISLRYEIVQTKEEVTGVGNIKNIQENIL